MPDEPSKKKKAAVRSRKRTRERSSQTDEEDASDQHHEQGCKKCFQTTNSRLSGIEDKLHMLLAIHPELETYKKRITLLEEENKALQTSLENSQAEIEDLKAIVDYVKFKQKTANTSSERIERELKELFKLECHSCRGNMKFCGKFYVKTKQTMTLNSP